MMEIESTLLAVMFPQGAGSERSLLSISGMPGLQVEPSHLPGLQGLGV
jgi:hypothetical protein